MVVTDTLPGSVTFVRGTPTQGGPCTNAAPTVTCDLGTVRAGAAAKVYIHVNVKASTTATVTNTAEVTSPTPDPHLANNSATITTAVDPDADLAIIKTALPGTVVAGDQVTYTLAVSNAGPADARAVTVTDHLGRHHDYLGDGMLAGTCANAGTTVTCSLGTVPALKSVHVEVVVQTNLSLAVGTLANTATVSSPTHDPELTDNSSTATSKITHSADVAITKTFDTNPTVAGLSLALCDQVLTVTKRSVRGVRRGGQRPPATGRDTCLGQAHPGFLRGHGSYHLQPGYAPRRGHGHDRARCEARSGCASGHEFQQHGHRHEHNT